MSRWDFCVSNMAVLRCLKIKIHLDNALDRFFFFVKEKKRIKVVIQIRGQEAFRVTRLPWPIQGPTCGGIFYTHFI